MHILSKVLLTGALAVGSFVPPALAQWDNTPNDRIPFTVYKMDYLRDLIPWVNQSHFPKARGYNVLPGDSIALIGLEDGRFVEFDLVHWKYIRTVAHIEENFAQALQLNKAQRGEYGYYDYFLKRINPEEVIIFGPNFKDPKFDDVEMVMRWHHKNGIVWSHQLPLATIYSPDYSTAMNYTDENPLQLIEIDLQTNTKIRNLTLFANQNQLSRTATRYTNNPKHKIGIYYNLVYLLDADCKPIREILRFGEEPTTEYSYAPECFFTPDSAYVIFSGYDIPYTVLRTDTYEPVSANPYLFWNPGEPVTVYHPKQPLRFIQTRPHAVMTTHSRGREGDMEKKVSIVENIETGEQDSVNGGVVKDFFEASYAWSAFGLGSGTIHRGKRLIIGGASILLLDDDIRPQTSSTDTPVSTPDDYTVRMEANSITVYRHTEQPHSWSARLYSLRGQEVTPPVSSGSASLSVPTEHLPAGAYFLRISSGSQSKTYPVTITK
jgi:hypothetical protein